MGTLHVPRIVPRVAAPPDPRQQCAGVVSWHLLDPGALWTCGVRSSGRNSRPRLDAWMPLTDKWGNRAPLTPTPWSP